MRRLILVCVFPLVLVGCHSLQNPFVHMQPDYTALPEETLREAAQEIEKIVGEEKRDFTLSEYQGIVIDSPEIHQAIRNRAARAALYKEFMASGFGCEESSGLVSIVRGKPYKEATTRQQRDRNASIVQGENQNRWTIYEGLVKANDWPSRTLSAIQNIFYEVRIAKP